MRAAHVWSSTCWVPEQRLRFRGSAAWARTLLLRCPVPSTTMWRRMRKAGHEMPDLITWPRVLRHSLSQTKLHQQLPPLSLKGTANWFSWHVCPLARMKASVYIGGNHKEFLNKFSEIILFWHWTFWNMKGGAMRCLNMTPSFACTSQRTCNACFKNRIKE